jgi:aspartyl-tRNA(Asn)/glutamyl-tRNA(Gln) amidotransferase subunit B
MAEYFERCAAESRNPRGALHWITGELAYAMKSSGLEMDACPLPPDRLAALIRLVDESVISGKMAKTVFEEMYRSGEDPASVVNRLGMVQIRDEAALEGAIDRIMAANPRQVGEYRAGREKVFGYFVGQVMKETKGQANPQIVNELLRKKLKG